MKSTLLDIKQSKSKGQSVAVVTLKVDLVLKHCKQLLLELMKIESKSQAIHIITKEGGMVDVSGIQLLVSLSRLAHQKTFSVQMQLPPECQVLLDRADVSYSLNHLNH